MEWSFNYHGPRLAKPDPRCATCGAEATKDCPTHRQGYALGCAHCAAAQGKGCQAHWGLEAAILACPVAEDAKGDFGLVKSLILGEPTIENAEKVIVTVRGSRLGRVRELVLFIRPV